ncbi:MAG: pyridine nucleotide-disulfide oxidoreductase [Bacteroidetes bacterium 4484_249]|nr:MAG: pyridine nucleotide-disulfide oxidoreductase [Bacteroidetes bacterium 4484_249]
MKQNINYTADILIIGAGPSGTIAASMVNRSGLKAVIVEKTKFPRFVIGESLLPRCMNVFEESGFLDAIEKQSYQKKYGAQFLRGDETCDFNFSEQFTDGWSWTWQVPRDHFDKVLADEVEKQGVEILYETAVTNIKFNGQQSLVTIKDKNGDLSEIVTNFVIDASGYGRVIANLLDLNLPPGLPVRNSLFTQVKDVNRPKGLAGDRITIIDTQPGVWIWIIPFSNGNTSVGFVSEPSFFEKYNGTNKEKLSKMLADELHTSERFNQVEYLFEPQYIEGYSIAVKQLYGPGYVLTGNATEFLDPVFSSGVTFAVESGMLAGKLAAKQVKGEKIDWDKEYVDHIIHGVETFRTYVNAWYDNTLQTIFFADKQISKTKNQICSVLAGYVWDKKNPYVKKHKTVLNSLAKVIEL